MAYKGIQIGRITEFPDGEGGISRINVSGNLLDDTLPDEAGRFNYVVEGDELNNLPPAGVGREKVLRNIIRREAVLMHTNWIAGKSVEPPKPVTKGHSAIGLTDRLLTGKDPEA